MTGQTLTSVTLNLLDIGRAGGDLNFSVYGLTSRPLVFGDVSTSKPYGSVGTTSASAGTTLTITLNAAALAAIGASRGGNIFIGGVDSGDFFAPAFSAPSASDVVLTLTTTPSAVPEPSSAALFGTMLFLAGWKWQRTRAH